MNEQTDNDIDYEHLDDLPLADHIEWSHYQAEEIITDDIEYDQGDDWLTA
jgi:hypothetical protein